MKTRLFAIVIATLAFFAVRGLADDQTADSAGKCPVSGKPASKDHALDYDGGKVYFCCDNCPKEFQANPEKYAAKAHLQMDVTGQLKQVACPFTGKPINPDETVEIGGVKVAFCCANCKKKAEAMEKKDLIKSVFKDISKSFKVVDSK